MTSHDVLMILVMTFPMFIFAIYPGLKLGDFLEEKYKISETQKRVVIIVTTAIGSLALSTYMHLG